MATRYSTAYFFYVIHSIIVSPFTTLHENPIQWIRTFLFHWFLIFQTIMVCMAIQKNKSRRAWPYLKNRNKSKSPGEQTLYLFFFKLQSFLYLLNALHHGKHQYLHPNQKNKPSTMNEISQKEWILISWKQFKMYRWQLYNRFKKVFYVG